MAKTFSYVLIIPGVGTIVSLFIVVLFVILQVIVNPRNHPVPFSVILGGDRIIEYPGDVCSNIELNSFTPSIQTIAKVTTSSIFVNKSLEQVLINHSLQVGYDPNQLTYYGVPVSRNDEVNLYIRASSISPNIQSVTVSVYDVEGFDQFLDYLANANLIPTYNLDMDCLQSVSGCTINSTVQLEGWLYFVFETAPTPSTLVVTLEATVRKYDVSYNWDECTLYGSSLKCFLEVPTRKVRKKSGQDRDGKDQYYTTTEYLPFEIIYETTPLISNAVPSSQNLNVSVDLSWTCSRNDLYNYIIIFSLASVLSLIAIGSLVLMIFRKYLKRLKKMRGSSDQNNPTNIQLETVTEVHANTEDKSLPPSYDKVITTDIGLADELPYYH